MKHLNITIQGKFKANDFEFSLKAVADQCGARGFVTKNKVDGSLYLEAEGNGFALSSLVEFCEEGPEGSAVDSVEIEEADELKGFQNFVVVKKAK